MKRASADVGLMFVAYNLCRILNIIGKEAFMSYIFAFPPVLGSILATIAPFWRDLKDLPHIHYQKFAYRRMDLIPILAGLFCNRIDIKRGY